MKSLSKTVLVVYLIILLWLVLFKFSYDIPAVFEHQLRSLNLIPFADISREAFDNFIVFIPFGLLLGVNLKRANFQRGLVFILAFSLAAEILQFIFAIGRTDITDVLTNTLGGLLGLVSYDLISKYSDNEKLDRLIVVVGMILLIALILLRVFVLRVKY